MKPEKKLWERIRRGMGKRWDACRHEDGLARGVPDVSWGMDGVNGWLELKSVPKWPGQKAAALEVPHFTPDQRVWLSCRGRAGGNCHLLLEVGDDLLLFDHRGAEFVGIANREALLSHAVAAWSKVVPRDEFAAALLGERPPLAAAGRRG